MAVDDSKVDQMLSPIRNDTTTDSKGDGRIFVSSIDDIIDIGTGNTGNIAL